MAIYIHTYANIHAYIHTHINIHGYVYTLADPELQKRGDLF